MYRVIRYYNFGAVDLHLSTKDYYPRLDWLQMHTMKYIYNSIKLFKDINTNRVVKVFKISYRLSSVATYSDQYLYYVVYKYIYTSRYINIHIT